MSERVYIECGMCYYVKYFFKPNKGRREETVFSEFCKVHKSVAKRRKALDKLTQLGQEMGGYDYD